MNMIFDSTVIVAAIGLFGTIYTVKTNALLSLNKQLFEMLEQQNELIESQKEDLIELRDKYEKDTKNLESKITMLTSENNSLRQEIQKLQNSLLDLKTR